MTFEIAGCSNIEIVRTASLEDAISLATKWCRKGEVDWFRGQTYPWLPRSSLERWRDTRPAGDVPDLNFYFGWLDSNPELAAFGEGPERAVAIAQHFGIPTSFVDVTTSLEVAVRFSRDRPPEKRYPGPNACIFCFSIDAMAEWLKATSSEDDERLQVYPVTVDVPELHRLKAQRGLFIHGLSDWYRHLPIRCILFPRGPPLSKQEWSQLYPPTNRLEEQLRTFLQAAFIERFLVDMAHVLPPSRIVRLRPPSLAEQRACFTASPVSVEDWPHRQEPWAAPSPRRFCGLTTVQFVEDPEIRSRGWLAAMTIHQLAEAIECAPALASEALNFILPKPLSEDDDVHAVESRMSRAWNAMGDFPFTIQQRLQALKSLVELGLVDRMPAQDARPAMGTEGWCEIALSEPAGASTTARIPLAELIKAIDNALAMKLSAEGARLLEFDPLELMRRVREPRYLFSFLALTDCFSEWLVPTQLLNRQDGAPLIASPGLLDYLGPP